MNNLKVKYLELKKLVPYARNARTHSDEQVAQIAGSIQEFGFVNPILIDKDGTVIAGHGRLLAAQRLGLDKVPTVCLDHLSEAQRKAYTLADNRLALNAGWDTEQLSLEMQAMMEEGVDLELLGFGEIEIETLLAELEKNDGLCDEDETPDLQDEVVSKAGDIWKLGKHRLMCGDSTSADDVGRLLDGVEPHLMVTDPPYGVNYDPDWRNRAELKNGKPYGGRAVGKVTNDDRADWRDAYSLFPGEVCYVWHPAGANSVQFFDDLTQCGFDVRMQIIWAKPHFAIGRGNYHAQHEPCWYAVRKKQGATAHWQGDRKQSTLWHIDNFTAKGGNKKDAADEKLGHGTQKPVECMRRPIVNNSSPGQAVYEPFSGSGTTIIAAEKEARVCYAMEIAPEYVDMAVRRWQVFTGESAVHARTGKRFG